MAHRIAGKLEFDIQFKGDKLLRIIFVASLPTCISAHENETGILLNNKLLWSVDVEYQSIFRNFIYLLNKIISTRDENVHYGFQ